MDGGAWWATVHGVAKSQMRLSDFTFFLWEAKILETMWCGPKQNNTLVVFRKSGEGGPMKAGISAAMVKLRCLPGRGHIPEVLESQPASVVSTRPQTWTSHHGKGYVLWEVDFEPLQPWVSGWHSGSQFPQLLNSCRAAESGRENFREVLGHIQ